MASRTRNTTIALLMAAAILTAIGFTADAAQKAKRGGGTVPAQKGSARTVTLKVGQGVDFARGRNTIRKGEAGLIFQYINPQNTSAMTYNPATNRMEYRVGITIREAVPVLNAAHSSRFKTRPPSGQFTSGDVYQWTEDDPPIVGSWYVVQSKLDDQHYLIHVTKTTLPKNRPSLWSVTLTYEPYAVRAGAAGARNAPVLSGTLRLKNLFSNKLIVDFDMKTGRTAPVADGFLLNMNVRGDMVYYDSANALIVTDPHKKRVATLRVPGESPAISPDGRRIALVEMRRQTIGSGTFQMQGTALGHVVIRDAATGREIAAFPEKNYCNWTPDGRVVMAQYGGPGLYVTDTGLQTLSTLTQDLRVTDVAASPNGKMLALVSGSRLWTINTDGSDLKQVAVTGRPQELPAWSPDSEWIAFSEEASINHFDVRAVRLSDGNLVTLRTSSGGSLYAMSRMIWRP